MNGDTADQLAHQLGVTRTQAQNIMKRMSPEWQAEAAADDAQNAAQYALAEVEAVQSINDVDVADLAEEPDPKAALKDLTADRASMYHMRAKLAAHTRWSREGSREEATRKARERFEQSFEDKVDPERKLPPQERARLAEHAKKAHFYRMAMKSVEARKRKRNGAAR